MLHTIYIANVALVLLLLLWPAWFSIFVLKLSALNPYTLTLAVTLPVEIMKLLVGPAVLLDAGLFDRGFQYALAMSSLHTVAYALGVAFYFWFCGFVRIERGIPLQRVALTGSALNRSSALLLCIAAMSFFLLASSEFGLINWIRNPREGYQFYRTGQGHYYAIAISTLSASMILAFLARPQPGAIMVKGLFYLASAYLLGSKMVLLTFFVAIVVLLWFIRWRHLAKFIILGAPAVFCLLVYNLYLALADSFELQSIAEYFDYYLNASMYYNDYLNGDIRLYYGEVAASNFWAYVPRAIWPDKPVIYGILLINEIYYPGQAELTNTPAFGGAVEQFADFGPIGVAVAGFFSPSAFLFAFLAYYIFRRPGIDFAKATLAGSLAMLVMFAPSFGVFFPGVLYLSLILVISLLLLVVRLGPRGTAATRRIA